MGYNNDKGFMGHGGGLQVARTHSTSSTGAEHGLGDAGTKPGLHASVLVPSRWPPVRMQCGPLLGHICGQSVWWMVQILQMWKISVQRNTLRQFFKGTAELGCLVLSHLRHAPLVAPFAGS